MMNNKIFETKPILIFTGKKGCGKSFLVNQLLKNYSQQEVLIINAQSDKVSRIGLKKPSDYLLRIVHIDEVNTQLDFNFIVEANQLSLELESNDIPKPQILICSTFDQEIPKEYNQFVFQFKITH